MDQETFFVVMTVFTAVITVSFALQAGMILGIYRASKKMNENVQRLMPKVESILESSRETIEESRRQINEITSKTSEILDTAHAQLRRVDDLLEDAASRAKVQMDRAEMVLDDAMSRAHQTITMVHTGVMKPIQQVQAVAAGIRTAFSFFTRGRPNPTQATADEEMFI
jgi:ABC-type transporter Mla subunit MlaD